MVTARHVLNDKILPVLRRRRKQSLKTKVDLDSNNLTDVNTSVHNNVVSLQQNSFLADGNVIDGKIYITKRHVSSRPKSKLDRNGLHFANTSERFSTPYIVLKYIQAMFVIILLILLALMIVNYASSITLSVAVALGQFCLGWLVTYFNRAHHKFTFHEQNDSSEVRMYDANHGWLMSYGVVGLYSLTVFVYMHFL